MPAIKDIQFRCIPQQSRLFLDYLDLSPNALRFYQHPPTLNSLQQVAGADLGRVRFPRSAIASILRQQNEIYGCEVQTLQNIGDLEQPECVVIATGQQVGLFTGPLYTIYKAFTSIHLARELRKHQILAVPIFWMDTEDHDLAEVTHRTILDPNSSLNVIDCQEILAGKAQVSKRSVGSMRFPEEIRQVVRQYLDHLYESDWKNRIQSQLESSYKPGATLAESFGRLVTQICQGYGLIIFDPQAEEAKKLVSPVFQQAIGNAQAIYARLSERNLELEASGFHTQVRLLQNSTLLFINEDGNRCPLERHNSAFSLRDYDRAYSLKELLNLAEQYPERFSSNVLLRPLIQDHLFPTIAYVAGPAEIAYFAQAEVLYQLFGRSMPVIWPRNSFTLLEPEIAAEMDRLGIDLRDCFQGKLHLMERAVHASGSSKAAAILQQLLTRLDQAFTEIRPDVEAIEEPLVQAVETAKRKIQHNVGRLQSRLLRAELGQNASIMEKINLLLNNCFPNKNLQERELNIFHFLSRHGISLLDDLYSITETDNFSHRIIRI